MPIRLKCTCGKVLSVRDELAGKAVKCPGCQTSIRVSAAAAPAKTATPARGAAPAKGLPVGKPTASALPAASATSTTDGSLDDLFSEAGFQLRTGKTCPGCFAALSSDAVLCTQCGLHLTTGDKLKAHVAHFEDEQSGEAYLRRAAADMARSKQMQEKMAKGAGMPWWMLGLVLFLLASIAGVAAISVNMSKQEDAETTFDAVSTLLLLAGIATSVVGIGAYVVVIYRACLESSKQGLLVLFVPLYILFYGITRFREVGMTLLLAIVAGGAAAGLFVFRQ